MKKTLILMLTLCLAGMLTACGTSSAQPANTPLTDTLSESATGNPQTEQSIVASDLKPSEGLEFESNGDDTCTLVGIGICKDADLVIPTKKPKWRNPHRDRRRCFYGIRRCQQRHLAERQLRSGRSCISVWRNDRSTHHWRYAGHR